MLQIQPDISKNKRVTKKSDALIVRLLAERIRSLRMKKGLSQEDFAERAMLHRNYIGKIERAEINPTIVVVHQIAAALDMDLPSFIDF
ncbi:MAG: hypothetical protein A2Z38_04070 [Planctomycetes bacterium RBG_19FT_COMBO_48_8]|nr:MAG: hypothetical protein A2Z38_04070 [Planctomycetes bacterium RBG_19FT_COMBO_48_8]